MTVLFQPDNVLPRDPAGFGQWLMGHYREHVQMASLCLALSPSVFVPGYDILSWKDEPKLVQQWLQSHQQMHQVLQQVTNLTGSDWSLVDFSDDEAFSSWMSDHANEHLQMRQVLGIS